MQLAIICPTCLRPIFISSSQLILCLPSYLSPRFPHKTLHQFLLSSICATRPAHLMVLDLITLTPSSPSQPPVTPSLLRSSTVLSTLASDTLSQCSSLNVTDQVSQRYKQGTKQRAQRDGQNTHAQFTTFTQESALRQLSSTT